MPTTTVPEAITPKSLREAEAALVRALQVRNADRERADASEAAFRAQCLESSLGGVTYTRINSITSLSKSRIDQLLRGERNRIAAETKANKKKS